MNCLIQNFRGEITDRKPIWFMRQAGRYLPEYRAIREKYRMLEVIKTPELASEVTLQPLRRFDLDAAIIFADILNPLMGMGIELDFVQGEGPKIFNPVRSVSDIDKLVVPDMSISTDYTMEAIRLVAAQLNPRNIPVIGFSGAPFTLSSYMIEGGHVGNLVNTKKLMFNEPKAWDKLQRKLVDLISDYLLCQAKSGVSAVQIFDSWLGLLSVEQYKTFVKPYLREIIQNVRSATEIPVVFFSTGTYHLMEEINQLDVNVVGVDFRINISQAKKILDKKFCLQGNLDPLYLFSNKEVLEKEVKAILDQTKEFPHVFNLGHGILPATPIENVEYVIEVIRNATSA